MDDDIIKKKKRKVVKTRGSNSGPLAKKAGHA